MTLDAQPASTGSAPRRTQLDRRQIARAAVQVGFDDLTVASVAKHLGVTTAALYHYVRGRDDLEAAAVDHVVISRKWPELTSNWQHVLLDEADAIWDTLNTHPGMTTVIRRLPSPPMSFMRRQQQVLLHLTTLGFSTDDALLALDTVADLAFDTVNRNDDEAAKITHHQNRTDLAHELDPKFLAAIDRAINADRADWLHAKLHLVIAGIEQRIARSPGSAPTGVRTPPADQMSNRRH